MRQNSDSGAVKRLNAGCGRDIRTGWTNLDAAPLAGVDVVHDLEHHPLPFAEGEFDEIECRDVLEHVEYAAVMKELHRILKRGGVLRVRVPHFTSKNNYIDPTHRKRFSIYTFEFFTAGSPMGRDYYYDFAFRRIDYARITLPTGGDPLLFYNRLFEPVINCCNRMRHLYEETFLSRLLPAENIEIHLVK